MYFCQLFLPWNEDVPLVEFMYVVFTRMPGEIYLGDSGLCCVVFVLRISSAD